MSAMQMMLAQLGLDPQELKNNAEKIGKLVESIDTRMANIEAQNTRIEHKLDTLLAEKEAPPSPASAI